MIMNERSIVEELLNRPPYDGSEECDNLFMEALRDELVFHYEHNDMYRHFCERKNFNPHEPIHSVDELLPVAVSVFKELGFSSPGRADFGITVLCHFRNTEYRSH